MPLSARPREATRIDLSGAVPAVPGASAESVMVKVSDPRTGEQIFRGTAAELSARGGLAIDDKRSQARLRAARPLCEQLMPRREGKD